MGACSVLSKLTAALLMVHRAVSQSVEEWLPHGRLATAARSGADPPAGLPIRGGGALAASGKRGTHGAAPTCRSDGRYGDAGVFMSSASSGSGRHDRVSVLART